MKLKFRANPKDWLIFAIFCFILLFFVAIAVVNLGTFAKDGVLAGLNPLPAFDKEYIGVTLVGFLISLIAIIMSVSSYFFDREKGFGVSAAVKKEKGYSNWAEEREFKKILSPVYPGAETADAAGIPLMNNGKMIHVDNSEYHNLIIGSTGSGKTQITVLPTVQLLAKKGESMIITDPKGEIYEGTATMLREKGYNIVLLNFRDPQKGNAWNPLSLPYQLHKGGNKDKATELLDDLAMNILYDEKAQNQDPFWEKTSADYFTGLSLGLFDDATEAQINLNSINLMTTVGEEKCMNSTYIKEYFNAKDPASPAYINASSTLMSPTDTKASILAVFKQKIKLFSSRENLSEMLSHSDFDMKEIGRQKTAVFIVIQDEKKTYHSLVTIFIKQCYETLIDVAQECGGKLPYRTNFILDEFANMPPLKDVTTMVTAARSRSIRFSFIIQNFAQLYQVYGEQNGETIKGNCGNIVYLISSELKALEEISKMCGEVKSKEKDKTASTPLVTVSDLQRMKPGEIIILRTRMMPFKTKMTYYYQMNWGKIYPKAGYPERVRQEVSLFDLKVFVNKKRDEKLNEVMSKFDNPSGASGTTGGLSGYMPPVPAFGQPATNAGPAGPVNSGMDDLVKRIDAKIAELEEQEKREKEEQGKQNTATFIPKPDFKSEMAPASNEQDDLIKRIDAKIAELEEQERLEKENQAKQNTATFIPKPDFKPKPSPVVDDNDDLIKRIDAKIAELEEQERLEKENAANQPNKFINNFEDIKDLPKPTISKPERNIFGDEVFNNVTDVAEEKVNSKEEILSFERGNTVENNVTSKLVNDVEEVIKTEPVLEKHEPIKKEHKPIVTDDQFFDDFFADDADI